MTSTPPQTRQKLEIESPDDRQARLSKLLSSVSAGSSSTSSSAIPFPPIREGPYHVPESDALKRARAFLPLFQTANTDLFIRHAKDPGSVNIENTEGNDKVIAMDLGLGVFDVKDGGARAGMGPIIDVKRRKKGKGKRVGDEAVSAGNAGSDDENREDGDYDREEDEDEAMGDSSEEETSEDSSSEGSDTESEDGVVHDDKDGDVVETIRHRD